ncbi:hypothetical protein HDU77_010082 [Chytriomyces hyalinus]|nr:hypothetical protein HDU77_010082 [Chytriomyces hyalinus]
MLRQYEEVLRTLELDQCTGEFQHVYEIPCKHDIGNKLQEGGQFNLSNIHPQWVLQQNPLFNTAATAPPATAPPLPPVNLGPLSPRRNALQQLQEKLYAVDRNQVPTLLVQLQEVTEGPAHPLLNPVPSTKKRGCPAGSIKRANQRDKSQFKYEYTELQKDGEEPLKLKLEFKTAIKLVAPTNPAPPTDQPADGTSDSNTSSTATAAIAAKKPAGFSFGSKLSSSSAPVGDVSKKPSWMSAGKSDKDKGSTAAAVPVKKLSAMQQIMEDEKRKRQGGGGGGGFPPAKRFKYIATFDAMSSPEHLHAVIQTSIDSLLLKKAALEEEAALQSMDAETASISIKKHMAQLHDYNKARDDAQKLFGLIAERTGETIKSVYDRMGIEMDD